jgi:hypothetical protein
VTEHFTQIVGADEAVRIVCQKLNRFAAPLKLPPMLRGLANVRRLGDVDVWFVPQNAGIARFHAVTHDDISIDVGVDFSELSSDYLEEMVAGVQKELNKHRAGRRGMTVVH